jgi:hypothetical protein
MKEVGLCQGGAAQMCKRSGAKLLSVNDIDRIFQRANIDLSERAMKQNPNRRPTVIRLADEALGDLTDLGTVEESAGDVELREKLRALFEQYDVDHSSAVSKEEVGKMAASLSISMTDEQLDQLMYEADPDGSGEIEFEEARGRQPNARPSFVGCQCARSVMVPCSMRAPAAGHSS